MHSCQQGNDAITMENYRNAPQKSEIELPYHPEISVLGYLAKLIESRMYKWYFYMHICRCPVHHSKNEEEKSIHAQIKKEK